MKKSEVNALVKKYFKSENYTFPDTLVHRFEPVSSAILYSLLRHYKPQSVLEIGSSQGGSGCIFMSALLKNNQPFTFYSSEIDDELRGMAEKNIREKCGQAPIMLGDITKELDKIPELDFLFVDTNHDLETTQWIIKNVWPRLKSGGIFSMHDWAVERDWTPKKDAWPETYYLIDLHKKGGFPFKKLFWTYKVTGDQETGFWIKP